MCEGYRPNGGHGLARQQPGSSGAALEELERVDLLLQVQDHRDEACPAFADRNEADAFVESYGARVLVANREAKPRLTGFFRADDEFLHQCSSDPLSAAGGIDGYQDLRDRLPESRTDEDGLDPARPRRANDVIVILPAHTELVRAPAIEPPAHVRHRRGSSWRWPVRRKGRHQGEALEFLLVACG
jgi:hypothetical protein